jgi:RHS repeat-associated protein
LDFYPYGATRISSATSTNERRKYIGQFSDDSCLSYLNARYYNPSQSQFLSQDPVFLATGDSNKVQQITQKEQNQLLADLQAGNAYSYGRDNPIVNKDASGLISETEIEAAYKLLYLNSGRETVTSGADAFFGGAGQSPQEKASAQAQFQYDFGTFGVTNAAIYGLNLTGTGAAIDVGNLVLTGVDKYCSGHTCKNLNQSQTVTAGQVLASIPTGRTADYTLPNRSSSNGTGGGPIWGVTSNSQQGTSNIKGNGSGGGGSGSPSIASLYQSFISLLTSYIHVLSAPASSAH